MLNTSEINGKLWQRWKYDNNFGGSKGHVIKISRDNSTGGGEMGN